MTRSPFQQAAPALRANGYSVIPLAPAQKYPTIDRWSEFCSRPATDDEYDRWQGWVACNVGVCLGPASGIIALDFDDDVDSLHDAIRAIIPESPVQKRGAKGFTAFYRFSGQKSAGYSVRGVRVLDVLSAGRQTVLPPSMHPSGGAYEWVTPATLENTAAGQLPELTAQHMQSIAALFRPEPVWQHRSARQLREPYQETGLEQIAEALRCIPADDYDLWIRMGMALKQHLGEKGFALWDDWSATSHKYNGPDMARRWASFRRGEVTIASLFYAAMDHGYVQPHRTADQPERPRAVFAPDPFPTGSATHTAGTAAPVTPPPADILQPPGLVGRVADWINATSIYPQPLLAVAAGIAVAGAAMAHKVQSPTRLRTNFYALGLAPSGAGKDHAKDCITSLLCRSGLDNLIGGTPASGAGLLTALREGGGRCLIVWDEFGRVLRNLTHKNAGSHQRDVLTYLIELFSSAKSLYAGVQYANHDGKMKRTPIDQPCLSVYAVTVPERFFQCLTSDDAIDGFLARWLVVESREYTLKPARAQGDVNEPPEALLDELRRWREAPSNYDPRGNMDGVLTIRPMTVSYSDEAEAMVAGYAEAMRRRAADEAAARTGLSAIYARCAEHAIKLALAAHEGDSIGAEAMRWGIAVADHCAAFLIDAVKANVASTEYEKTQKHVLKAIAGRGSEWVSHSDLVRATRSVEPRKRTEALQDLADAGLIEVRQDEAAKNGRPPRYYRST